MIEADAVGHLQVIRGIEGDALVPLSQRDRPQDLQVTPRRRQFLDTRLVDDQMDPGRGAAVHDRYFGVVQFDDRVVDAKRAQGGEKVLDGFDRHGFTSESGLILLHPSQMRDRRWDLNAQICSMETDAVIGRSRLQRECDLVTGMKSDPGAGDVAAKCALSVHSLSRRTGGTTPSSAKPLPCFSTAIMLL